MLQALAEASPSHAAAPRPDLSPEEVAAAREALWQAAARGDVGTLEELLQSGAVGPCDADSDGDAGLHWAAMKGQVEAIRVLLAAGAAVGQPNAVGRTPLLWAAGSGQVRRGVVQHHS